MSARPFDPDYLRDQGYSFVVDCGDGRWAGVMAFMFTVAIVVGRIDDHYPGYDDRWCYGTTDDAITALNLWMLSGFEGEPQGWHRHPASGRRRTNGDPETEYINL